MRKIWFIFSFQCNVSVVSNTSNELDIEEKNKYELDFEDGFEEDFEEEFNKKGNNYKEI